MQATLSRSLFIRIVPTIVITVICVGIAAFYSASREISRMYDAQMISDANTLWAIVADEAREAAVEGPKAAGDVDFNLGSDQLALNDYADDYNQAHMFRVWHGDKIVLSSHDYLPASVSRRNSGFSQAGYRGERWRIYALPIPHGQFSIEVGENLSFRNSLANNILLDLFMPLIALLPVIGILIWVGIDSGLGRIRELVRQIRMRSPENLSPVEIRQIPRDIAPLGESVNQLLEKLAQSFAAEKRFVDDAAHHLRTPLASLKLQLQMLKVSSDPAEKEALLGELIASTERASKMVNQLLAAARLGSQPAQMSTISLYPLVSSVMAELGVLAGQKGIEMSLEGPETAQVRADEPLLRLIVQNLVENAIKYSPVGESVKVETSRAEGAWKVTIRDNGPGIPEDECQRVFERFHRVNRPSPAGSGLGLSIVAESARKLGAKIALKSPPFGKGLIAELSLPMAER